MVVLQKVFVWVSVLGGVAPASVRPLRGVTRG